MLRQAQHERLVLLNLAALVLNPILHLVLKAVIKMNLGDKSYF